MQPNKVKTIGIIGGFGPEGTAQFYVSLVKSFRNATSGLQPRIIIINVPVKPELEHELLLRGGKLDAFIPLLTGAASELECAGADVIVFPCNTLHVHADAIRKSVHIPFINIIKSSVQNLHKQHIQQVGLLGTSVTIKQNLFAREDNTIEFVPVPQPIQIAIDSGIDKIVAAQDKMLLQRALRRAFLFFKKRGVVDVLLACTDFHGLCPMLPSLRIHDTVDILVDATVRHALENEPANMLQ